MFACVLRDNTLAAELPSSARHPRALLWYAVQRLAMLSAALGAAAFSPWVLASATWWDRAMHPVLTSKLVAWLTAHFWELIAAWLLVNALGVLIALWCARRSGGAPENSDCAGSSLGELVHRTPRNSQDGE